MPAALLLAFLVPVELGSAEPTASLLRPTTGGPDRQWCPGFQSGTRAGGLRTAHQKTPRRQTSGVPGNLSAGSSQLSRHLAEDGPEKLIPVVDTVRRQCLACHVEDGLSGHTRLVFPPVADQASVASAFGRFLDAVEGGVDRALRKIAGEDHGGGLQVLPDSADYTAIQRFLEGLGGEDLAVSDPGSGVLGSVKLASPERTLRRAALVLAGRVPSEAELALVSDGSESSLRRAVRQLMTGRGFHEFLIRSANDRLLTDRFLRRIRDFRGEQHLVDLANLRWKNARMALGRGYQLAMDDPYFRRWEEATQFGFARAPLELIAHVVESDRPYTEILTADYTMANPMTAAAIGSPVQFESPDSPHEFRPARIRNYYRTNATKQTEFHIRYGTRVTVAGNLDTEYPHAGVLSTFSFLRRYPTSAVNRNRSRARWTLLHFLGVDVGRAVQRSSTLRAETGSAGPAVRSLECAGCHSVLDPVAGTFQFFDAEGGYKTGFGGSDSLPESHRSSVESGEWAYQSGDTWYRDMDPPGLGDERAPSYLDSLQWLARRIADDPRFAESSVRFWWPAVLGSELLERPGVDHEPAFSVRAAAAEAQQREVRRLAQSFRAGFHGGPPFNAKDLLTGIILSPWFRAEAPDPGLGPPDAAAQLAGAERLLTPEELSRKSESLTGYRWGRHTSRGLHEVGFLDGEGPRTGGEAELLYGGIDSGGIQKRATTISPLMAAVAQGHALHASCAIVQREFYLWPPERRLLFGGIASNATPEGPSEGGLAAWGGGRLRPGLSGPDAIRWKLADLHWKLFGDRVGPDSPDVEESFDLFRRVWERKRVTEGPDFRDGKGPCLVQDTNYFEGVLDGVVVADEWGTTRVDWQRVVGDWSFEMPDPDYAVRTWVVVLAHLLMDYRYLYL